MAVADKLQAVVVQPGPLESVRTRETIHKTARDLRVHPNLEDYEPARKLFTWERARAELAGLPGAGLNIAYEALERQAGGPLRSHRAIRWIGKSNEIKDFTYSDLERLTSRF
ncbi:MAG TPA: hypothetical protein VLT16_11905, partial [Candidatus Limnocylindrales bacterium]|nr:hypothetical protein [Candidatus Limnocylindrales bacterium]